MPRDDPVGHGKDVLPAVGKRLRVFGYRRRVDCQRLREQVARNDSGCSIGLVEAQSKVARRMPRHAQQERVGRQVQG